VTLDLGDVSHATDTEPIVLSINTIQHRRLDINQYKTQLHCLICNKCSKMPTGPVLRWIIF